MKFSNNHVVGNKKKMARKRRRDGYCWEPGEGSWRRRYAHVFRDDHGELLKQPKISSTFWGF